MGMLGTPPMERRQTPASQAGCAPPANDAWMPEEKQSEPAIFPGGT
jgi:hypothetical protein